MIFHVCSHWGDIEIESAGENESNISYFKLTPLEREALDAFLRSIDREPTGTDGTILVPKSVVEVGAAIGEHLHGDKAKLTAIKFASGEVKVTKTPVLSWFRGLWDKVRGVQLPDMTIVPEVPEPVAAVQTPVPTVGCPMPTMTDLREAKAAAVVRKFLVGQQIEDFNRRRAFIAIGCDTGRVYRVTSRWAPEVEKYGVLHDMTRGRRICAQNKVLPPSEEVLSMKFAVEHMEQEFLGTGFNR